MVLVSGSKEPSYSLELPSGRVTRILSIATSLEIEQTPTWGKLHGPAGDAELFTGSSVIISRKKSTGASALQVKIRDLSETDVEELELATDGSLRRVEPT